MSLTPRLALAAFVVLAAVCCLVPCASRADDKPAIHQAKVPPTRKDLDRREAQRLYALGALQERKNLLLEAVRSYEGAARLDPDSAAVLRALAPLYFALDRPDDALAACKRILKLDPDDM